MRNGNQSSVKCKNGRSFLNKRRRSHRAGLKGVADLTKKNYLGASLAWRAHPYNSNSAPKRIAYYLHYRARDGRCDNIDKLSPIITHQLAMKLNGIKRNLHWLKDDIFCWLYALAKGKKCRWQYKECFSEDLEQPIFINQFRRGMPT